MTIVGPQQPAPLTFQHTAIELVLLVCPASVGACECPPNSNAGPYVERIQKLTGLQKGDPWCACELRNVGLTALGKHWPIPAIGGCASLGEWAASRGILVKSPAVGDAFLLWELVSGEHRFAHTGLIIGPATADGWATHEGNTSGAGSTEGWLVGERRRIFKPEDSFIRWAHLVA